MPRRGTPEPPLTDAGPWRRRQTSTREAIGSPRTTIGSVGAVRARIAIAALLLLAACADTDSRAAVPAVGDPRSDTIERTVDLGDIRWVGRVDLQETGNRVIAGSGSLTTRPPLVLQLGAPAAWIVPAGVPGADAGGGWLVADVDGGLHQIAVKGEDARVESLASTIDAASGPPLFIGGVARSSPDPRLSDFEDPLPDSRVVVDDGTGSTDPSGAVVALVSPTDRYGHGVLGDRIEAGGFVVRDLRTGGDLVTTQVVVDGPDVIEAVSPLLADVDDDGTSEVVVTLANSDDGARLAVYELDGTPLAASSAIGRGNRWRNLLAVAPIGPNGETEVIDVRTPHIGGTLQFFRLTTKSDGSEVLAAVARRAGYSTHTIGSRNLDLGIVSDADGDGRLDVVLPTRDRRSIHVVSRTESDPSGTELVASIDLGASISSNVAAQADGPGDDGAVSYAVGTRDGRVHLFPAT